MDDKVHFATGILQGWPTLRAHRFRKGGVLSPDIVRRQDLFPGNNGQNLPFQHFQHHRIGIEQRLSRDQRLQQFEFKQETDRDMVRMPLRPRPCSGEAVSEDRASAFLIDNGHMMHMESVSERLDIQFETAHAVIQLYIQRVMAVIHAGGVVCHRCRHFQHHIRRTQMITVMGADNLNLV
ncbi:MAG: hypothetical protein BWX80_03933 [Candidatus Hydrogenedentes bacterium ADurb.Bin101]|nr:MAG: hypothetical protein BWX80_03933 [Candidatus Hydrogenedentes bacterium ADurb.Bin101]